jgi:hypothetical protein
VFGQTHTHKREGRNEKDTCVAASCVAVFVREPSKTWTVTLFPLGKGDGKIITISSAVVERSFTPEIILFRTLGNCSAAASLADSTRYQSFIFGQSSSTFFLAIEQREPSKDTRSASYLRLRKKVETHTHKQNAS